MITKCPHCNTKFKVRDEYKSRKTKCSKCEQSFIIAGFIRDVASPIPNSDLGKEGPKTCNSCWTTIGNLEKGYSWNNLVLCAECYEDFRKEAALSRSSQSRQSDAEDIQKGIELVERRKRLRTLRTIFAIFSSLFIIGWFILFAVSSIKKDEIPLVADVLLALVSIGLLSSGVGGFIVSRRLKRL